MEEGGKKPNLFPAIVILCIFFDFAVSLSVWTVRAGWELVNDGTAFFWDLAKADIVLGVHLLRFKLRTFEIKLPLLFMPMITFVLALANEEEPTKQLVRFISPASFFGLCAHQKVRWASKKKGPQRRTLTLPLSSLSQSSLVGIGREHGGWCCPLASSWCT